MKSRSVLTPLGFRRDIRLFLIILVTFLSLMLVSALIMTGAYEADAERAIRVQWQRAADSAAEELGHSSRDRAALETVLQMIRARYGAMSAVLVTPSGQSIRSGNPVLTATETSTRSTNAGTLTLVFDAEHVRQMRRTFALTAAITLAAAGAGIVLFLFYLPTVTGPIQAMLDSASQFRERDASVDEREYLIDTFRQTIETLKRQESELQQLHERERIRADDLERVTAALTRSINSGFLALDPAGRVIEMNSVARDILSPLQDDGATTPREIFGDNTFSEALTRAVLEKLAMTRVEVDVGAGPAQRTIGLTTVPLLSEEQQFLGVLALFTDLTPLRSLENRVRELQSLADLGEISAGIAHEFRNSLATVLGYLRLARRATESTDALAPIENAEREANLLSKAVDALLAFARPMSLQLETLDLLDLTSETCDRLRSYAAEVPLVFSGEAAHVLGDSALLARAIENLLRNSIESVRQRGSGEVRVRVTSGDEAGIRIEDDGTGFDESDIPRLLLPFQTNRPGGHGIGLPLARKIILLHGGTLQLSGAVGRGAVATLRIPRHDNGRVVTKGTSFATNSEDGS